MANVIQNNLIHEFAPDDVEFLRKADDFEPGHYYVNEKDVIKTYAFGFERGVNSEANKRKAAIKHRNFQSAYYGFWVGHFVTLGIGLIFYYAG